MTQTDSIKIVGARENNLKNITLDIPKEKIVVLTGVSGSGKSSLAFDTIAAESARQWQASYPLYTRNRMPRYERPAMDYILNLTPSIVVDQKPIGSNIRSTVGTAIDAAPLLRLLFSRVGSPSAGGSMAYSLNHPHGMCPKCTGLGRVVRLREDKLFDMDRSINEGAILFSEFTKGWQAFYYYQNPLLDQDKKLRDYTPEEWKILCYGPDQPLKMQFLKNANGQHSELPYEGVILRFNRLYVNRDISKLKKKVRDEIMALVETGPCDECGGVGLNPKALS